MNAVSNRRELMRQFIAEKLAKTRNIDHIGDQDNKTRQ
jgi:hypothetical protein